MPPKNQDEATAKNLSWIIVYTLVTFFCVLGIGLIVNYTVFFIWLYQNHEVLSRVQISSLTMFVVFFSVFSYSILGIKQAFSKAYLRLYNLLVKKWVLPFAAHITELIWEKKNQVHSEISKELNKLSKETNYEDIEMKAFAWLNAKIYALPPILAKVLAFFLKLTPIGTFVAFVDTQWLKKMDSKEKVTETLALKIDHFMKNVIEQAFPFWTKLLLPLNIVLVLVFLVF